MARRIARTLADARAIAVVALVVALTGVTPADAVRAARHALFAEKAASVNGIKASRTPRPNRLLPLGGDGRFPASVLPAAAPGPRGPRGAQGPTGPRGPSDAWIADRHDSAALSRQDNVPTEVAALELPAGSYLVRFHGVGVLWEAGKRLILVCQIRVNGAPVKATYGVFGDVAAASPVMALSTETGIALPNPSRVTLTCFGDQPTNEPPAIQQVALSALSVANLSTG